MSQSPAAPACPICSTPLAWSSDAPERWFCRTNPFHVGMPIVTHRPGTKAREVADLLFSLTPIWPAIWSVDVNAVANVLAVKLLGAEDAA